MGNKLLMMLKKSHESRRVTQKSNDKSLLLNIKSMSEIFAFYFLTKVKVVVKFKIESKIKVRVRMKMKIKVIVKIESKVKIEIALVVALVFPKRKSSIFSPFGLFSHLNRMVLVAFCLSLFFPLFLFFSTICNI